MCINNYYPTSSTYISVISSGKLGLISDLSLKDDLVTYWDVFAKEAELGGKVQSDFLVDQLVPGMIEHTEYLDVDTRDLTKDGPAINRLLIYQSLIANTVSLYEKLAEAGKNLKEKLTKELNNM